MIPYVSFSVVAIAGIIPLSKTRIRFMRKRNVKIVVIYVFSLFFSLI